jgi:hypothetical protein
MLADLLLRKGFSKLKSREILAKSEQARQFARRRKSPSPLENAVEIPSSPQVAPGIYNKIQELQTNKEVDHGQNSSNEIG